MESVYQVDPADLRFTQETVGLYFKRPYQHFSIREAVRKISRNEMSPYHFVPIRVISYGGHLWSVDNRRLWVFRFARCSSITVVRVTSMHPRMEELIANHMYGMMQGEDFFPHVRDRGLIDMEFNLHFPQPCSRPSLSVTRFNSDRTPMARYEEAKPPMRGDHTPMARYEEAKPPMSSEEDTRFDWLKKTAWDLIRSLGRFLFKEG